MRKRKLEENGVDVWGISRVGMGVRKIFTNLRNLPGNCGGVRDLQSGMHIARRQNTNFDTWTSPSDPTIIPDSPVEYLRKCNLTLIYRFSYPLHIPYDSVCCWVDTLQCYSVL